MGTNISQEHPACSWSHLAPEDGDNRFLWNLGTHIPNYMAAHSKRLWSEYFSPMRTSSQLPSWHCNSIIKEQDNTRTHFGTSCITLSSYILWKLKALLDFCSRFVWNKYNVACAAVCARTHPTAGLCMWCWCTMLMRQIPKSVLGVQSQPMYDLVVYLFLVQGLTYISFQD